MRVDDRKIIYNEKQSQQYAENYHQSQWNPVYTPNFLIKDMLTSLTIKAHKNGDITTKVTIAAIIRPHSGKISTINGINHILETIIIATISDE